MVRREMFLCAVGSVLDVKKCGCGVVCGKWSKPSLVQSTLDTIVWLSPLGQSASALAPSLFDEILASCDKLNGSCSCASCESWNERGLLLQKKKTACRDGQTGKVTQDEEIRELVFNWPFIIQPNQHAQCTWKTTSRKMYPTQHIVPAKTSDPRRTATSIRRRHPKKLCGRCPSACWAFRVACCSGPRQVIKFLCRLLSASAVRIVKQQEKRPLCP